MINVAGPFIYPVNPNYWDYGILGSQGVRPVGMIGIPISQSQDPSWVTWCDQMWQHFFEKTTSEIVILNITYINEKIVLNGIWMHPDTKLPTSLINASDKKDPPGILINDHILHQFFFFIRLRFFLSKVKLIFSSFHYFKHSISRV